MQTVRSLAARLRSRFGRRGLVLLYHRVGEPSADPQLLSVSPARFAEHLEIMREHAAVVPLQGLKQRLAARNSGRRAIIITFDDGYADNLLTAAPILAQSALPATVFVAAGTVERKTEFWWDELERLLLQPGRLPRLLKVGVNGVGFEADMADSCDYTEIMAQTNRNWSVLCQEPATPRHAAYRRLCVILRPLPLRAREETLTELRKWAGTDTLARASRRALTADELRQLAASGLVEVGAHTVNHPVLAAQSLAEQRDEIVQSKARLENILGKPVTSFSYPYGGKSDYTRETVALCRKAGFQSACSNFPGLVSPRTDPFQLPRFLVRNWDADTFRRKLREWLRG